MIVYKINIALIFLVSFVLAPYSADAQLSEKENNSINKLYATFEKSIEAKVITQANSLKLTTSFYSKLLDSSITTSLARIIIMVNSKNRVLKQMYPSKKYMRGKKNESWYWHSFILYNGIVFDTRFKIAPCKLRKYFDIVWNNDKNLKNFSIYSIQMKDLIYFMDIRTKRNKAYFGYVPVKYDFLIKTPFHLSAKISKHDKAKHDK